MTRVDGREDTYTTAEVARMLQKSTRRVLQMLETGELEGDKNDAGRWRIPQRAVRELLPAQPARNGSPTGSERSSKAAEGAVELRLRIEALQRELGRLEGRLELTGVAESTLREQLQRERERADRLEAERDRLLPDLLRQRDLANAERERAERFEAELREALEARRGWLRRFFGF